MPSVLHGVRVVAFANGWAGPLAGEILGDFGADVIKVESCQRMDWARGIVLVGDKSMERLGRLWEWGTTFNSANHNTRSLTLELSTERGRGLFKELVAISDVVVENFSPRVLPQLGLGYEELRRVNPSIILVSMPAFGGTGPWKDYLGYAQATECMGGLAALCGDEGGSPILQGSAYGDPLAGITAAMAAIMALWSRQRTGKGQRIEVSHIEAITPHVGGPLMDYQMNRRIPPRRGNRSPRYAPHGCYRAAGADRWVVITVTSEEEWKGLCAAMGRPELVTDPRFGTMEHRVTNAAVLDGVIEEWTAQRERYDIMRTLQAAGVPAGPVLEAPDLLENQQLAATGFFVRLHKEPVGPHPYPGVAARLSETPGARHMAAPTLGQHNGEVLGELLALPEEEVRALEASGVIGYKPIGQ